MAETIVPPTARTINFAASGPFYILHADVTSGDVQDQLSARLGQLAAMLQMTHGGGFETFNIWSDDVRANYLWACSMLAEECKELCDAGIIHPD